ncbi:S1C family serine protease [Planctomycetota bacterium]
MDNDQNKAEEINNSNRKRMQPLKKRQLEKFFFIWVGCLSAVVIIVAVVANFNIGKESVKTEMSEHWSPSASNNSGQAPIHMNAGSQAASLEHTYNMIARTMSKVTVSITGGRLQNNTSYNVIGSGVFISHEHILTNRHVVEKASPLNVTVYDPAKTSYPAELVGVDRANDLAVLKIQAGRSFPFARLGNSDVVDAGDIVFSVGNPLGFGNTITSGIISDRSQSFNAGGNNFRNMFQTNTDIHEGSSGGPLVNISGEVIGINTAIYAPNGNFTGIGFATPINRASTLFQQTGLNTGKNMQLAASGCFVNPTTPNCTLAAGIPNTTPFSSQRNHPALGTILRCPNCNSSRYFRCPVSRRRLVLDANGRHLVCPVGHANGGISSINCPGCQMPMVVAGNNSYAQNPYSMAA